MKELLNFSASKASKFRPVKMSSIALDLPTARINR